MAINRDKLFNDIANGAAWDSGVVFNRTNPIPIDKFSVFESLSAAQAYVTSNPVAYPGQLIAVVPQSGDATGYIILANGTLKELGAQIDLTNFATKTYVDEAYTAIPDSEIIALFST